MKKRFQFRHVNELTGIFVLVVLLAAAAALYVTARSQHWFAARIEYQLQLPPAGASGLQPGNEVVVLGLPAGMVKDVQVNPAGGLDAHITLRRDFAQFIRADSTATIRKVFGVAGDSFVELTPGTVGDPLPPDASIPCESTEELPSVMDRLVEELRSEAVPLARQASELFQEWSELGANLNRGSAHLEATLDRLDRLSARLEAGEGSAGRLLMDARLVTAGEETLAQAQATLDELAAVLEESRQTLAASRRVIDDLAAGTAPLGSISRAIEGEARDLPGLVLQLQQASAEMRRLLEGMERHWLLRAYVPPRRDGGRIPPDEIPGGAP